MTSPSLAPTVTLVSLLAVLAAAQTAEQQRRDPAHRAAVRHIALTGYARRLRRFYGRRAARRG